MPRERTRLNKLLMPFAYVMSLGAVYYLGGALACGLTAGAFFISIGANNLGNSGRLSFSYKLLLTVLYFSVAMYVLAPVALFFFCGWKIAAIAFAVILLNVVTV